jgi:hypothetical protein
MDGYCINTDKNRQSQDEWIQRRIAVVTDSETLRTRLANKEGVLAIREVLPGDVIDVREKSSMGRSA